MIESGSPALARTRSRAATTSFPLSAVFLLQLAQSPELTRPEVAILFLPHVECGLAHSELPADVGPRRPAFGLPQGLRDLLFRKPRSLHLVLPPMGSGEPEANLL